MKKYVLFTLILISIQTKLFSKNKCDSIYIFHSYEDLYITYITPLNCEDKLKHGPISLKNKKCISKILLMKKKLKKISEGSAPDVRFKIILFSGKKITKLCYGHSSEVVIINGQKYEFNKDLNKFIIKIIEKKGYKRPQRAKPPL